MSLKRLARLVDEFLSADGSTLIGIHERRKNEGSAKNPPKGKFVGGVFYVAANLRGLRVKSRELQG
jgi:hypothetical protein